MTAAWQKNTFLAGLVLLAGFFLLLIRWVEAVSIPPGYLPQKQVGPILYGPHVCGVTAPCAISAIGTAVPQGQCGVDYFNNVTSPYNDCNPGVCRDICTTGLFCDTRITGVVPSTTYCVDSTTRTVARIPPYHVCGLTPGYFLPSLWIKGTPVTTPSYNCSAPDSHPTTFAFTVSGSPFNLYATPPPLPCVNIPDGCKSGVCVQQQQDQVFNFSGILTTVPASQVCCSMGFRGDRCEIDVGCAVEGCLHGGSCLTVDKEGHPILPSDQRCFGCNPGINGTLGWGGRFCEVPNTPTFSLVNVSTHLLSATSPSGRRLLQVTNATDLNSTTTVAVRTNTSRTSDARGFIYREPSRVCDCGVSWTSILRDQDYSKPLMLMGNYNLSSNQGPVLLSPIRFGAELANRVTPVYRRQINQVEEAEFYCSRDWDCGGYYYDPLTHYFSAWSRGVRATAQPGPTLASLGYLSVNMHRYSIERLTDPAKCSDATLVPSFYCDTYPSQCRSVLAAGGIGNYLVTSANNNTQTLATLHFHAFGHLTRNQPNAFCDLTVDWAEDETGCSEKLRAPKFVYPPSGNLTDAICGNSSRVDPQRVAFGPLQQGVTGYRVIDGGQEMCHCNPPFDTTNPNAHADCAYDLCGQVDGRGQINATYANALASPSHFNHSDPSACVCFGAWGTDSATCDAANGLACDWCRATLCENGGTIDANATQTNPVCHCLPIFAGPYCEQTLCNATHSNPFNYSQWVAAGRTAEQIVCDCQPGWTGTLCDQKQCVYGEFNYQTQHCDCVPGFTGVACDEFVCGETRGQWTLNGTSGEGYCVCHAPWTGSRCQDHTCDLDNDVLSIPGWNGVRPFGQPKVTPESNSSWECGCNWPYAPRQVLNGKAQDCQVYDCNYGYPNANASLVLSPADACTCVDSAGIGILTDPAQCTDYSHDACPRACKVATCSLTQFSIDQIGQYVPVGDTADCCRCPATAGMGIEGECQPFCAFYQPCLTTNTSSFAPNPTFNATETYAYANPEVLRVKDTANKRWVCKCNAQYTSSNDQLNDCSIYSPLVREAGVDESIQGFGVKNTPPGYSDAGSIDGGGSGGGSTSITSNPIFIGILSGVGGLFLVVVGISAYQQYQDSLLVAAEQEALVGATEEEAAMGVGQRARRPGQRRRRSRVFQSVLVSCLCVLGVMEYSQAASVSNPLCQLIISSGNIDWYGNCPYPDSICPYQLYGGQCNQLCPRSSDTLTFYNVYLTPTFALTYTEFYANHALCSYNGRCESGVCYTPNTPENFQAEFTITKCKGGCRCNSGYTGDSCQRAIQTQGDKALVDTAYRNVYPYDIVTWFGSSSNTLVVASPRPPLNDFSVCCPFDNPDCSPIRSRIDPSRWCVPTRPCNQTANPNGCECGGSLFVDSYHVTQPTDATQPSPYAPFKCGEDKQAGEVGWLGNKGGKGKCWSTIGFTSSATFYGTKPGVNSAFCFCNTPASSANGMVINGRRGWFGPGCTQRTCTNSRVAWVPLPGLGKGQLITIPSTAPLQCGGHSHPQQNGISNNYDDDTMPCDDKGRGSDPTTMTGINTQGTCIRCADGWGLYSGYRWADLAAGGWPTTQEQGAYGLCNLQTHHSGGGVPCGGYGVATQTYVQMETYASTMNIFAVKRSYLNVTYTSACSCPSAWGLLTMDSGICQRTCAGSAAAATIPFNLTDAYGNFIGKTAINLTAAAPPQRCGGYKQGLCRPIVYGERNDGWNSACMCNVGYNGPNCDRVDSMWVGNNVCGINGEGVLLPPPKNTTRLSPYDDADWFYRYIVPLNGLEILTSRMYSPYACQCLASKKALGYVLNPYGICVRGTNSSELRDSRGVFCAGHGRVVIDSRVDTPYNAREAVCQCDLGWGGLTCSDVILHDLLGAPCGGTDRGTIVYTDATNMTQQCVCRPPYIANATLTRLGSPTYGICSIDCPNHCTDAFHGACVQNLTTGNENYCVCRPLAFGGLDCSVRLTATFLTQSGAELPCTGHGVPDPELDAQGRSNGLCKCDLGWTGYACEMYFPNRDCGFGQPFLDTESVGIVVK